MVEHFSESMRFENDGTGSDQTDATIKIVSESGVQALGQLKVGYSALSDMLLRLLTSACTSRMAP